MALKPKYVDYAEYYDQAHDITVDIPFYVDYAKQTGGPVLELACGTGRVLVPIAEEGIRIHGLDSSENMLKIAEKKIQEKKLNKIATISHDSMEEFDLPEKEYSMAFIAVRSFMHLFTQRDQIKCLECVHNHLGPDGLLLLDLYAPSFKHLAREPSEEFRRTHEFQLPNGNRVVEKRRYIGVDLVNQLNTDEITFMEYDGDKLIRSRTLPLITRFTFRYELELLLEKCGYKLEAIYRDYDKNPYDGTGEIITVATKNTA